jgi:serine/threonine-protein kinase RsbW
VRDEEYPGIKGLIENYYEHIENGDYAEVLKNSLSAPYTASVDGHTRVFVILDDFHRSKEIPSPEGGANLSGEFSEVLNNRFSPHLITGYSIKMLKEVFGNKVFIGISDIIELRSLAQEELILLFENLCDRYKVKFLKGDAHLMVTQLNQNPFYVKSFVRSARHLGVTLHTLKDFQKHYLNEVTSGSIGFYFTSILNSFVSERERRSAIKILEACFDAPIGGMTPGFLAEKISLDDQETAEVLTALQDGGLLEMDFGRVTIAEDSVMKDFVSFKHATIIDREEPSFVKARMENDGLKALSRQRSYRFSQNIKEQAVKILESFDCQKVPEVLFQYDEFSTRFSKTDFFNVSEKLRDEDILLDLPQIIGVADISSSHAGSSPANALLLGHGFTEGVYEDDKEVVWISAVFTAPFMVGVREVKAFLKNVSPIKEKVGTLNTDVLIIGKDGFTEEAVALMSENGIKAISLTQMYHLRDILFEESASGLEEVEKDNSDVRQIDEEKSVSRENEFELILPMAVDTELVAAKAIEEIANRANFDEDAIGQIKMALIEACINATEHSRRINGKISLRFVVHPDRLTIYVQNDGESFDPSLVEEPNIDDKIMGKSKRGWGLKLMKSFMDEVKFEKVNQGTKLKMTKFVKRAKEEQCSD